LIISAFLALPAVAVDPPTTAALAPAAPLRLVFLGDSLTAGYGLDPDQAYPALIEKKLADAGLDKHWIVVNAGVSGDTSADGLHRLNWLLRQPIAVLIIALGGNDGLRGLPIAALEANLQAIIDQLHAKYPASQIIVAGMEMPPNLGAAYTAAFAAVFPRVAQHNHAALIPFLLEDVAAQPSLMQLDGIHPNAAGAKIVADVVWKDLEPLLKTDAKTSPVPAAKPSS
jgi:acyl-CoA thioesterase I